MKKLRDIIQLQSNDASKLMRIVDEFKANIDKVVAENLDLHRYMAQDLEKAEEKMEKEFNNRLVKSTERINENKDNEIRLLQQQLAKCIKDTDIDSESAKVNRELNFQSVAWPQGHEQAQHATKRTIAARSDDNGLLQCYIGSQESLPVEDKLTDDQARHLIQQYMQDTKFLMVGGVHVCVSDVAQDIGKAQRQRVLQKSNAQVVQQRDHHNSGDDDAKELLEEAEPQPQSNNNRPGDDHDDSDDDWLMSMIPRNESGK